MPKAKEPFQAQSMVGDERKKEWGLRRRKVGKLVKLSLTTLFWCSRTCYALWLVGFDSFVNTRSVLSVLVNQIASAVWPIFKKEKEICFVNLAHLNDIFPILLTGFGKKKNIIIIFSTLSTPGWCSNHRCERRQTIAINGIYTTQNKTAAFRVNSYIWIMWSQNGQRRYKPSHRARERHQLDQMYASNIKKSLDKATATPTKNRTRINMAKYDIRDMKHHAVPANSFN